ncbi:DUF1549 domain-containing protein [Leptospira sp. GIMC2001]|uniref:DUF1549 domain-containing protein n=1 Tax=Leptospira sp. GIMC2001 TaxID=1513297 RepID=UPI002349CF27|nr:DUF1549 domain-containing protein [Leptospira sp. GIMC2001]WCL49770.1 DUF1553 domain-containing protein [Leptospira sp. GIMC2001]
MRIRYFYFSIAVLTLLTYVIALSSQSVSYESEELDKIYSRISTFAIEPAKDPVLLRRLSLNIKGTIPDGGESLAYANDNDPQKFRDATVRYLKSPEFAEYWGIKFASMFREQTNRRKEVYGGFYKYLSSSLHDDKPYNSMVREMLTASGSADKNLAVHFYGRDAADPLQVAEYVGRVFYAQRVGCARCHDDKFDPSFTQRDYYALAAFFGQQFYRTSSWDENKFKGETIQNIPNEDIERLPLKMQKSVRERNNAWNQENWNKMSKEQRDAYNKKHELTYAKLYYEPSLGVRFPIKDDMPGGDLVVPKFLDGTIPSIEANTDRRKLFADWLLARENQRFRKVIINRIWKELMGWSFFSPEDDWNKNTKMEAEPILIHLDQVFLDNNHSIKYLIYYIVNSKAYSRRNAIMKEESDKPISFYPSNRMDPDQLMNSIVKGTFEVEQPKWMFSERRLNPFGSSKPDLKGTGEIRVPNKDKNETMFASEIERPVRPNHFLAVFGSGARTDVSDDHSEITIDQILTLMNGRLTGKASWDFGGKDSQSMKTFTATKSMEKVLEEVNTILLGRGLTEKEKMILQSSLTKGDAHFERTVIQDWVWAVLNSQEFLHVN